MDDIIEYLKPAGLIEYWYLQSFNKKISKEVSDDRKQLTLDHLSGCFQIWVGGCVVSFLGFVGELIHNIFKRRTKKRKRQLK